VAVVTPAAMSSAVLALSKSIATDIFSYAPLTTNSRESLGVLSRQRIVYASVARVL